MNDCKHYTKEQLKKINKWLASVGASYENGADFWEYKKGQLLEIAERNEDSLITWDEWQHIQALMGMEISLDIAIKFTNVLWENDIEVEELDTDASEEFYKGLKENYPEKESESEFARLARKYGVYGDDVETAYGAYLNMINMEELQPLDAEEIVYESKEFDYDHIADSFREMMDYILNDSNHLRKWRQLKSGRVVAWCD